VSRRIFVVAAAIVAAVTVPATAEAAKPASGKLRISTISTKPQLVTGGDVLAAVDVSGGANPAKVKVRLNGADVTADFAPRPDNPDRLVGLVDGLAGGDNLFTSYGPGVKKPARLSVFNSPITGPVFSGPQQTPFFCRTEDAGLGPATDADCSAATTVTYYYRAANNTFKPLPDPNAAYPADGVQTTTRDGVTVDYVVRLETGVINRSIYRFAILAPGGEMGVGWNKRFVFGFGGGCSAGHEQGNRPPNSVLTNPELSEGYATLTGSLNVFGTACNDVLSAESAQMLKEHVIEELGEAPAWTMGQGGSGGSVQQQMIAQNYPGILDGIMPGASFADGSSPDYPDCRLLQSYFSTPDGSGLTTAQKLAVTGFAASNPNGCAALSQGADVVRASEGCDESQVPPAQIFDPVTNPGGIRCTVWDSMINIYGADPATGYARRTLDNVGVQYGLRALSDGDLTVDQFLDLNEGVGGFDDNGDPQAGRSVADNRALAIAYESGRVNVTAGGYTDVPALDIRDYVDDDGPNVHQYVNTYKTRARIDALHGNHDTQVMWRAEGGPSVKAMNDAALDTLGRWMDAIHADDSDRTANEKVVANKPADAVDACWIGGNRTNGVAQIGASNVCETTYPPHSLPANVAGKPLDSTVLKCQLSPIDYGDYPVAFDPAQKSRLEAVFPDGVCDWSKPGVEEADLAGTWQEFGPERVVKQRKRTIGLRLAERGPRKHRRVEAVASLGPCPQTTYQEVVFEKRSKRGGWRRFATGVADGGKCRASATLRLGSSKGGKSKPVRIRARADAVEGYRAAKSKSKRS